MFPIDYTTLRNTPYILGFLSVGQVYNMFHEHPTIASGNTVYIEIRTGAKIMHVFNFVLISSGGSNIQYSLYEGATFTGGTTPVTIDGVSLNRRIGSLAPSGTTFFSNPTAVNLVGATLIDRRITYSTGGGQGGGNIVTVPNLELILEPNTSYLVVLSNTGGNNTSMSAFLQYYESGN